MNLKAILSASIVVLGLGMSQACASTLTATSTDPTLFSDFSIDFSDNNNNSLLDILEISNLSGFTIGGFGISTSDLITLPSIANFTNGSGLQWVFNCPFGCGTIFVETAVWSYNLQLDPSPVPIPAALPLFAAGLSAMGFMGWRRKRKTIA